MNNDELCDELSQLIVETLRLETVNPKTIAPDAPLFVEGLGLDSLDALELAVALEYRYGFQMKLGADEGREAFRSVRTLAELVRTRRTK